MDFDPEDLDRALRKFADRTWDTPAHTLGRGSTQAAPGNHVHGYYLHADKVASMSAGWVDLGSPAKEITCTLHSGMATFSFTFRRSSDIALTANTSYSLGFLAKDYWPSHLVRVTVGLLMSNVRSGGILAITTAGELLLAPWASGTVKANTDYVAGTLTYRALSRTEYTTTVGLLGRQRAAQAANTALSEVENTGGEGVV